MRDVTRIGMDTSKSVFQLHGVDKNDHPVLRRRLRRQQVMEFFSELPAVQVGIEACGGSHHWARELAALGHDVKVLPAQHVKPYVRRNKNDAADAEAICEAMSRPRLQDRFVPVKTMDHQAGLMLMGVRDQLINRRTQLSNTIRGHAAEFGLVAAKGLDKIESLLARIAQDAALPDLAQQLFAELGQEYVELRARLDQLEVRLMTWHRANEMSRRLAEIPGIGPICATALVMKVPNPPRHETFQAAQWCFDTAIRSAPCKTLAS